MRRTLATAAGAFGDAGQIPIVAMDELREVAGTFDCERCVSETSIQAVVALSCQFGVHLKHLGADTNMHHGTVINGMFGALVIAGQSSSTRRNCSAVCPRRCKQLLRGG